MWGGEAEGREAEERDWTALVADAASAVASLATASQSEPLGVQERKRIAALLRTLADRIDGTSIGPGEATVDVFVAYRNAETGADAAGGDGTAVALRAVLEHLGIRVFFGAVSLSGGQAWVKQITHAAKTCAVFCPVVSRTFGASKWTLRELQMADESKRAIVPVWHSGPWPPATAAGPVLAGRQRVPSSSSFVDSGSNLEQLLERLLPALGDAGVRALAAALPQSRLRAATQAGLDAQRAALAAATATATATTLVASSGSTAAARAPKYGGHQIMLSYRIRDTGGKDEGGDETVFLLRDELERRGFTVFVGESNFYAGPNFVSQITDAVLNCEGFVPLCSEGYGDTIWTFREMLLADDSPGHRVIVPVWHSGVSFPPPAVEVFLTGAQRVPYGTKCVTKLEREDLHWVDDLVTALALQGVHPGAPAEGLAPLGTQHPRAGWPCMGRDPCRSFNGPMPLAAKKGASAPTSQWRREHAGIEHLIVSPFNNQLLFATGAGLYSWSVEKGGTTWELLIEGKFGMRVPCIDFKGDIMFSSWGKVHAVNPRSGRVEWEIDLDEHSGKFTGGITLINPNCVTVGTWVGQQITCVQVRDVVTPQLMLWKCFAGPYVWMPSVAPDGDVYFSQCNRVLRCAPPDRPHVTGRQGRCVEVFLNGGSLAMGGLGGPQTYQTPYWINTTPMFLPARHDKEDTLMVVADNKGEVICLRQRPRPEGVRWTRSDLGKANLYGVQPSACVSKRIIFFPFPELGVVHALQGDTGKTLWTFAAPSAETDPNAPKFVAGQPLVLGAELVLVGAIDCVFALDVDTGQVRWKLPVKGRVVTSVVFLSFLLVATDVGVECFKWG